MNLFFLIAIKPRISVIRWDNPRFHQICFSSLRDSFPSLSGEKYHENDSFVFFLWFLFVLSRRVNPVNVTHIGHKWLILISVLEHAGSFFLYHVNRIYFIMNQEPIKNFLRYIQMENLRNISHFSGFNLNLKIRDGNCV